MRFATNSVEILGTTPDTNYTQLCFPQFILALVLALPYPVVINRFISVIPTRLLILDIGDGPLILQQLM